MTNIISLLNKSEFTTKIKLSNENPSQKES